MVGTLNPFYPHRLRFDLARVIPGDASSPHFVTFEGLQLAERAH